MKLDPNTTVGNLLRAIPSSAAAFQVLGIAVAKKQTQTLDDVCGEAGITFDQFLIAMDGIDWEEETPLSHEAVRFRSQSVDPR